MESTFAHGVPQRDPVLVTMVDVDLINTPFIDCLLFCLDILVFPAVLIQTKAVVVCCSVAKSCRTLCDPMDCSTPGSPELHLPEFTQSQVH